MFRFSLLGFCILASTTATHDLNMVGDTSYMENELEGDCYELTPDSQGQSGAIWSNRRIDVTQGFTFTSQMYLGTKDSNGADGIAFSLQANSPTQTFSTGGRWYASIPYSVVCEVDTWHNSQSNITDGTYSDHIQLTYTTGDSGDWNMLSEEAAIENIEDGQYHDFEISWDPASEEMIVSMDGSERIKSTISGGLSQYLNGENESYFGFTAATGGASNSQRVCFNDDSVVMESAAPTPLPTSAPSRSITLPPAGSSGDPHFTMWTGEKYDFHGACDLVLLQNPDFNNGLGMDIHIRTKFTKQWSYITSAVLRIGNDTFEVMAGVKNPHWINKVQGENLEHGVSGFSITFEQINSKSYEFRVDMRDGSVIIFKTFGDFLKIDVEGGKSNNFVNSRGLMGNAEGEKVARDRDTIIEDNEAFGLEWQVLGTEPMLFHKVEGVQAPEKCALPTVASRSKRRRLSERLISMKSAQIVCSHVNEKDRDNCMFDVLATNDEEMAGAY